MKTRSHILLGACVLTTVVAAAAAAVSIPVATAETPDESSCRVALSLRDGEDSNLYVGDPLSGVKRLTHDGISDNPTWSPDGRLIAYVASTNADSSAGLSGMYTTANLMVVNPANGETRALTSFDRMITPHIGTPAWSPDGQWLAFSFGGIGQDPDLYLAKADGSALQALTDSDDYIDRCPTWSPDGRSIAFVRRRDAEGQVSQVYTIPLTGGTPTRLAEGEMPVWSPDGRSVTLVVRNGNVLHGDSVAQLVRVNIETGDVQRLGKAMHEISAVRWAPDGGDLGIVGIEKKPTDSRPFAYTYHYRVYLLNANGENLRQLIDQQVDPDVLCWSPDGSQIMYAAQSGLSAHATVRIMSRNGSNAHDLLGATSDGDVSYDWGRAPASSLARFTGTWAGKVAINDRVFPIEIQIQERDGSLWIASATGPKVPCDLTGPLQRDGSTLRRSARLPDLDSGSSQQPFFATWALSFDASDSLRLEERVSSDRPRYDGPAFPVYELRSLTSLASVTGE